MRCAAATRFVAAALVALFSFGCRHERREQSVSSAAPIPPAVPEPAGLVLQGVLRHPEMIYTELVELAGGRARLLPKRLAVAVATALFDSPLAAGLVDDSATVALAVVQDERGSPHVVGALRLTSGRELVAALTTGSDAKFTAERNANGVVMLRSRRAPVAMSVAVFGDRLLLSDVEASLIAAGPYVSRSISATDEGSDLELVASRAALAGPIASLLRAKVAELRDASLLADVVAREQHGGRAPDFADPSAVVGLLSGEAEDAIDVVSSSETARLTAALSGDVPVVRLELTPDAAGPARELARSLPTGTLEPLLAAPDWTDAAVLHRSSKADAGAERSLARRLEDVLGERLAAHDRSRVRAWLDDGALGIGATQIAGIFDAGGIGFFVEGPEGNGDAIRRATLAFPGVLATSAVAEPLKTFVGHVDVKPVTSGPPAVASLAVRVVPRAPTSKPFAASLLSSSVGAKVAALFASSSAAQKLHEVLVPDGAHTLSHDVALASEVARARSDANAALFVRVRTESGGESSATLAFGSDRKVTWAEVCASKAAFSTFVHALLAR